MQKTVRLETHVRTDVLAQSIAHRYQRVYAAAATAHNLFGILG